MNTRPLGKFIADQDDPKPLGSIDLLTGYLNKLDNDLLFSCVDISTPTVFLKSGGSMHSLQRRSKWRSDERNFKRVDFVLLDDSFLKPIDIGVLQGSILGPLLFLICINDIPNSVKCTPRLFADDICLLMGTPSITILENQLKDDLNNICNWISANALTLN